MSQDCIILDLDAVRQRAVLYKKRFPAEKLGLLYKFDARLTPKKNLSILAGHALSETNTAAYVFAYKPIFLQILAEWTTALPRDKWVSVLVSCGRIASMYPLSLPLTELFVKSNVEYFTTILQNSSTQHSQDIFSILLAYYRLLYCNKEIFSAYIQPDILYQLVDTDGLDSLTKLIALKVLALYLDMGEQNLQEMMHKHIPESEMNLIGPYELDTKSDYHFLEVNEAMRFSNFASLPEVEECFDKDLTSDQCYVIDSHDLNKCVVSVSGILVPKVTSLQPDAGAELSAYPPSFVPTKQTVHTLRELAKLIRKSEPIMLLGKAGSGKTFLINELSKYMGCHDSIVKIHLGEQTDAKLLIGTYTSGEKPGTFEWRSGVLTNAVKEGRWVLIEDIDKAPTEVLSILLSLLEKRELTIPSRGEVIKAANGFQIISTVRMNDEITNKRTEANERNNYNLNIIGMRVWRTVHLDELTTSDVNQILCRRFPVLLHLIPKLIDSYESVKAIYLNPNFISFNKGAHPRVVSIRDLVKLCNRLNALFANNNIVKPDQLIQSEIYDSIFAETADCFAGAISEMKALTPLIHSIGQTLEIANSRIALFLTKHVPQFESSDDDIKIGRAVLKKSSSALQKKSMNATSFAMTNHSLKLMEQISVAIQMTEPVLLVGETGTGKTTVVQQLAKMMNKPLTVINVSQQTETGDLLGGYKPVNSKIVGIPVQETFESLFSATFSLKKNERFYKMLHKCFNKNQWKNVVKLWNEAYKMAQQILHKEEISESSSNVKTKKRKLNPDQKKMLLEQWDLFRDSVVKFEAQSAATDSSFVFDFVEGSLVKAVRNGEWLLLDEINLASPDTLESISDLLNEADSRSILLSEKGDAIPVKAHTDFRIFACMNPATDVGKRDLPIGLRSRLTEIYVHSPDRDISDLLSIIDKYIGKYSVNDEWVGNDIAELYIEAKRLAENNLIVDGSNQKPHFSVRTLTRTLLYVCDIVHIYGLRRSLYDGFCMTFLTLLDQPSEKTLEPIISKYTVSRLRNVKSVLSQTPPSPGPNFVQFKHYWMKTGQQEMVNQPHYIITPFVEKNMMNLVRATSGNRFPVLVQGPTSAGKTSMIKYLADITGHKFVRINNHEHTDLQEYLGTYVTDDSGKLSFKEGVLVEALRKGYWIVLDELNLAPTDVLEALNRLLDDNRELFIPETQEVIHPHPDFMLFATQNPPGIYGGRKILSRAFRNRFLELHFDDIPTDELEIILRERCQIAPTYAKKIVEVYHQLSIERSANRLFEQKNSFATLRDLFRWALRGAVGYDELAANGYMLLGERCRNPQEKATIKKTLEKVMKVKLNMDAYYSKVENKSLYSIDSVVWTSALRRLSVLVSSCLQNNEPVLLVGETGCGKTTICQLLAQFSEKKLVTLNAHQNTETGDILGAQRPMRNRSEIQRKLVLLLQTALGGSTEEELDRLVESYNACDQSAIPEVLREEITQLQNSLNILFEWCDGPLVQALKDGDYFLLDEISLADDSVLERLNSVLEPERSLLLAEKGSSDSSVVAKDGFQFFATMNPGGDYGKKELSPALRNRFTEIWVPSMESFDDVRLIVSDRLCESAKQLTETIVAFSEWYAIKFGGGDATSGFISLRDILAWVDFINRTTPNNANIYECLGHGASMVFIDALGTNNTAYLAENEERLNELKSTCVDFLSNKLEYDLRKCLAMSFEYALSDDTLKIGPFSYPRNESSTSSPSFNMNAPTTAANLMRVIRAMQVEKPILLEGSPGVGKTSLVTTLAELTGNKLTRINLSEQTDLIDLFGSDVPGERSGEFVWNDAPFLRAMQQGHWVLLDEMNLASQSVLEGLNACLDHRGEAYIPELDRSFTRHPDFLVFAAQNPQYQGGGRKGLPKSFVNRFTVVYIDVLKTEDLQLIANHLYPSVAPELSAKMIKLMGILEDDVTKKKKWGVSGSPWEFNLRDALRWLKLLSQKGIIDDTKVFDFVDIIIRQRFRTKDDKQKAQVIIENVFGSFSRASNLYRITPQYVQVNSAIAVRNPAFHYPTLKNLQPLECNMEFYESAIRCINNNWPLILVGPANSGKTELVRFLSSILGTEVCVFSMNSDLDSMDILGGYEQVDMNRKIWNVIKPLKRTVRKLLSINLGLTDDNSSALLAGFDLLHFICDGSTGKAEFTTLWKKFKNFQSYLPDNADLLKIADDFESLDVVLRKPERVAFEWFDGILLKAIENGDWLVLDNANLCSPSVLDRLNSLLETDGSLLINECSMENGEPRILKPHPNFRLFLTVDPKYGELSRAMRNRGIELYMEDLDNRLSSFDMLSLNWSKQSEKNVNGVNEEGLELNPSTVKCPTKSYVPSYLSLPITFSQILDVLIFNKNKSVLESLAGIIPINLLGIFEAWSLNITQSVYYPEGNVSILIGEYIKFLNQRGIVDKLNNVSLAAESNIWDIIGQQPSQLSDQPLVVILNEHLIPRFQNTAPFISSGEGMYLFAASRQQLHLIENLEKTNTKSLYNKIDDLTYIERSAAIVNGRQLKNVPRIPIYYLLCGIVAYISNTLCNDELFVQEKLYEMLAYLEVILESAFESASSKDEAKLRVYKELLEQWISSAQQAGIDVSDMNLVCSKFDSSLGLTRGFSMTILWEEFRTLYPQTGEAWQYWNELAEQYEKFEKAKKMQFPESYDAIRHLSQIFSILSTDILNNDIVTISPLLDRLRAGINDLEEISAKFLNKRKHFFSTDFDTLLRLLSLHQSIPQQLLNEIIPFSSVPLERLNGFTTDKAAYPAIFDMLWVTDNGKHKSFTESIITSNYLESIILKTNRFHTFPGSQITPALFDARLLLSNTIKSADYLLHDKISLFTSTFLQWVKRVLEVHTKLELESMDVDYITEIIVADGNSEFSAVFHKLILPAIKLSLDDTNYLNLGQAWILFGTALIELYAPNIPYDPAVHDYVVYDIFLKHKLFLEDLGDSWSLVKKVISGDDKLHIERTITEVTTDDAPQKPRVYRPAVSVDNLIDEWNVFYSSTVSAEQASSLFNSVCEWDDIAEGRFEMFQQNSSSFINRLNNGYQNFADLNEIFAGYVFCMKFGFDLARHDQVDQRKLIKLDPLWCVDPLKLSAVQTLNDSFTEMTKFFKDTNVEDTSTEKILILYMDLFKLHQRDDSLSSTFMNALQMMYQRWSLRRMKKEQEEQEASKLFKYEDTSEDFESEFKRMFPLYEESLSLEAEPSFTAAQDLDTIYYEISKMYMSIFLNKSNTTMLEVTKAGLDVVEILLSKSQKFASGKLSGSNFASSIISLHDEILSFNDNVTGDNFDFYRDSSLSESQRAFSVIDALWKLVNEIHQQWPEHATLSELERVCQEFLSFPANTPIAKQLQKIEQIYTFMAEWEKYAASRVSLGAHIKRITDLIVSWRKLELQTWNGLFNTEDKNAEKEIGKWWFNLFEIIFVAKDSDPDNDNETALLTSLNIFFSKSTAGEFKIRLKLVEAFANHIVLLNRDMSAELNALQNILSFYKQFLPTVEEQISKGRKSLSKEVSETILLASWKDVNVDALKQSSRKSHNNLYKLVRKYRAVLSSNVLGLIEGGLPYEPSVKLELASLGIGSFAEFDLEDAKKLVIQVPDWDSRSMPLRNINLVKENMSVYANRIDKQTFPNMEELARDYGRAADRLQEETPTVYKKENKKLLATLKVQKAKVLSDALKELRRIGLKTSFREDIHKVQASVTSVLANSVSFNGTHFEKADAYFFKILDMLPRLRNAISSPADDIPPVNVEKGMAIIENLLFSLITTRKPLKKANEKYSNIEDSRLYLENICTSTGSLNNAELVPTMESMRYMVTRLQLVLDYALKAVSVIEASTSVSCDIATLQEAKMCIQDYETRLSKQTVCDTTASVLLSDFRNYISNFVAKMMEKKNTNSFFIFEIVITWIKNNSILETRSDDSANASIKEVDQVFRKVHTSIILAFQRLMENETDSVSESDDQWLVLTSRTIMGHIKSLNITNIAANIQKAVMLIKNSKFLGPSSSLVRAIITFTLPVINHYFVTIRSILEKAKNYYTNTSHGTYILANILHNLAKNGFCHPQAPSDEVDNNNLQDGTGLGDGEGAQNNSKDIEQDEDLTEDAQTANKDQKDKDERDDDDEREDDAVEMEGDMAGEMEEVSDQENSDEEDLDEEENDLDEEVDDIDDDDPNAIDDKMWNEKAEEDTKEKDTDKQLDLKDDDDVQAGDDENNGGENKDKEGADQNADNDLNENEPDKDESKDGDAENDEDADEEEGVGEQEDEVRDKENEELHANAPEIETMDLPDDINLDSEGDDEDDKSGEDDVDMESEDEEKPETNTSENQQEPINDDVEDEMDVDEPADSDDKLENDTAEPDSNNDNDNDDVADEGNPELSAGEEEGENEEELAENQANDDKDEQAGAETSEGLGSVDNLLEEETIDAEAAVQQQSGSKGAGSDSKDSEEQEDIGSSGNTQNPHDEDQQAENENLDNSRKEAKDTLQQLGDSLKEFHRRRKEIEEAGTNEENEDNDAHANERPDDFEHVEGANTETDTQALGSANQDQTQAIDEDLAIDDDDAENVNSDDEEDVADDTNYVKEEPVEDVVEENNTNENDTETNNEVKGGGVYAADKEHDLLDEYSNNNLVKEEADQYELEDMIEKIDLEATEETFEKPTKSLEESRELWHESELSTADLVSRLGEQLRLILEPTKSTKLKGDYKTGKRLNMKRIIPYIASQFRKDKIWLRRTKPSKREYQIMIALDNSKSMSESKCVKLAFDSLCLVSKTLTQLESGGLSIVKFGEKSKEVHHFGEQFSNESGAKVFQRFDFQDGKTDVKRLVAESIKIFERGRGLTSSDQWQLEIVISDGICEDHETIKRLVRRAKENKIMLVFVIIDGTNNNKESIMDMSQVDYIPDKNGIPQLRVNKYLDTFPFEFYVIVHSVLELPEMLSGILRQYFSDLASS
ncbi:AAA family ATPase midasin KNAG_0G02250 [Huiozyma naganishii CBS 8797]|uniref:Midasin n=1 Tax=Huiozyma naganishii (strain ATCC MYA-139 / BCRC 22969 / CBS 8797 / KCTC 17520 / NBRC 10181 / NCYC 3082 / Yp74L-3) TaxID=1071383 RepID=J7RNU3_HUIN7|nr:hypothetical protein KNAG_0G02250 [Kazachstania naganishii CBS 8797]CCK71283.1 hypothetical protein KNAG_0G02250 [Kazachstania naganishii CBS 8797]